MFRFANHRRQSTATFMFLALLLAGCDGGDSQSSGGSATDTPSSAAPMTQTAEGQGGDGNGNSGRPVDSETLPYADVNEELVYGYFAFPSDMIEPLPAVIVVHDWWGLNDDTRDAANRLAAEGYMVLAVDLYGGETVTRADEAREKMISVVESTDDVEENIRQALLFVDIAGAPSTAALGWGFGGGWSLNLAIRFPEELDAIVIYYGQVTDDEGRLDAIQAPVLGLFGERDRGINVETVRNFEAAMQRLRKEHSVHVYPDTGHAFADPARSTYDADIVEDAWQRTIDFLAENLSGEDES